MATVPTVMDAFSGRGPNATAFKDNLANGGVANPPKAFQPSKDQLESFKSIDQSNKSATPDKYVNSSGLHPKQKRMSLSRIAVVGPQVKFGGENDEMMCHYNPESVQEVIASEYFATLDNPGVRTERYQFKSGKATTWSMTILLSTWGDDFNRRSDGALSVADSLNWIRDTIRPSKATAWREGSKATNAPPPVFVNLFDKSFLAYLQQAQITFLKLNPNTGAPIRAEVGLSFIEYVNSSI